MMQDVIAQAVNAQAAKAQLLALKVMDKLFDRLASESAFARLKRKYWTPYNDKPKR